MWTSRNYESEHDLRQMQDLLMAVRAATGDWRYAHVGELMWNFFMVACHLEPREYIRLWHDPAGRLIGFAILGEDPSFDWHVRPEHEWRGIEAEALDWATARLAELCRADPQRWCGPLAAGARQDNAARIAFLVGNGFRYSGEFAEVNMLRPLDDPIPAPAPSPGYEVRAVLAEPGEIAARGGPTCGLAAVVSGQRARGGLCSAHGAARLRTRARHRDGRGGRHDRCLCQRLA